MLALARRIRARRSDGERGDTLVEIMLTVIIVGISFTGILFGLATAINLSGIDRGDADVRTMLVSSVESVKSQPYVSCPSANGSSYNPALGVTVPSGWVLEISQFDHWNGTTWVATCPATDQKLQKINVKATSPDGRSKDSIEIIKRGTS